MRQISMAAPAAGRSSAAGYRLEPLLIVLLAAALYAINIAHREIDNDELYHVLAARGWLATGVPRIAEGIYARGFFTTWLVAQCFRLFGDNMAAARLPSLVTMALLAGFLFVWLRAEAGRLAAWLGAGLFALSPFAVDIAQFARFYAMQVASFTIGACMLYAAIHRGRGWLQRGGLALLALLFLLLAVYFQVTTLIGMVGLGLWAAGAVLLPWSLDPTVPPARKRAAWLALLALAVLAVLALATTRLGPDLLLRYRTTPLFNQDTVDQPWFYHLWYELFYPSLWPLLPFLALVGMMVRPWPTSLALVVFAVAFLLQSFAAAKAMRYIAYAQPFLFALWGIGLAGIAEGLWSFTRGMRERLTGLLPLPGAWPRRLVDGALVLAILFLILGNSAFVRTATLLADITVPPDHPPARWDLARAALAPQIATADVMIVTDEREALYYLGRYDVLLNRSRMTELDDKVEFERDGRTGRPVIATEPSLAALIACHPTGLIVSTSIRWQADAVMDDATRELISRETRPLEMPRESHVVAFTWRHEAPPPGAAACQRLPALGRAPQAG